MVKREIWQNFPWKETAVINFQSEIVVGNFLGTLKVWYLPSRVRFIFIDKRLICDLRAERICYEDSISVVCCEHDEVISVQ